jgi:hypothetical protein
VLLRVNFEFLGCLEHSETTIEEQVYNLKTHIISLFQTLHFLHESKFQFFIRKVQKSNGTAEPTFAPGYAKMLGRSRTMLPRRILNNYLDIRRRIPWEKAKLLDQTEQSVENIHVYPDILNSQLKNHSQPRYIARYVNVYKYGEQKIVLSSKIVIH